MMLLAGVALSAAADEKSSLSQARQLQDLLRRFNETQQGIQSLTASFAERKNLSLLARPVVASGTFLFAKPGRVKWEYSGPEPRTYLITEDRYLAYYPAQKRAEEVPLSKFSTRRVFRVFGIGQTSEDLGKFFDLSLGDSSAERGSFLLVLTPKRRRVRDRLQLVRFWVDGKTYLPRRLEYVETDGDSTTLTFSNIQINPRIGDARFTVDIPKDVRVSNTFSGFSGTTLSQ